MYKPSKLAIASAVLSLGGVAQSAMLLCCNCSLERKEAAVKIMGVGDHFGVDEHRVLLTKWMVEDVPDGPYYIAWKLTIPAALMNQLYSLVRAKITAGSGGEPVAVVTIPINVQTGVGSNYYNDGWGNATGYDIIANPGYRNLVGTSLANTYTSGQLTLFSIIMSMNSLTTSAVNVHFLVTFKTGVQVVFVLTSAEIEQALYQAGRSRDAEGNTIPD